MAFAVLLSLLPQKVRLKFAFWELQARIEKYPPTLQTLPRTCPHALVLRAVRKLGTFCLVVTFLGYYYTRNEAGRAYHSSVTKFSIALGEKSPL
jgi:hypothetical protein